MKVWRYIYIHDIFFIKTLIYIYDDLNLNKFPVVTAKHPNDALCTLRIKGDAFDLVVSDVHMPDMNGFELQEAIAHEFNLPVVCKLYLHATKLNL